jgi:phytoene dehydrogenase-like protein
MLDAVVVGAGLAGLACAHALIEHGLSTLVVEASDGPGGRARTDTVDGFLLDRGFQVLLTAYPEARRILDYDKLALGHFQPGAIIRAGGRFHRIADPWRAPTQALKTALASVGTLGDKWKIARLRREVTAQPLEKLFSEAEHTTCEFLKDYGFSEKFTEQFLQPFLAGIFLEERLVTSSRMFEFVFRMFSEGAAALPAGGMGAMAQQLASRLPYGAVQFNSRVQHIGPNRVILRNGQSIDARSVILAADFASAPTLLPALDPKESKGTVCVYFAAKKPPVSKPLLVLNGESSGPVNNLCVPSLVCPTYAPNGFHLISTSVVGTHLSHHSAEKAVREHMTEWFGPQVEAWHHLRTYSIPSALPGQTRVPMANGNSRVSAGLYVCGDYRDTASINGALRSGRHAAQAVVEDLR